MKAKPLYDLLGNAPNAELDFFVEPNSDIGPILYGYSSCKVGENPPTATHRFVTGMLGLSLGVVIGIIISYIIEFTEGIDYIWYVVICIGTGGIGYFFGKSMFIKDLYYVGTEGIEHIQVADSRENIRFREIFLFANALELKPEIIAKYKNGAYEGTDFTYRWYKIVNDKLVTAFETGGYFYAEKDGKVSLLKYPLFHHARRAEEVWNKYLYHTYTTSLQKQGFADFYLTARQNFYKDKFIRISPNYVELHSGGKILHIPGSDIYKVSIQNSQLRLIAGDFNDNFFKTRDGYIFIEVNNIVHGYILKHFLNHFYFIQEVSTSKKTH